MAGQEYKSKSYPLRLSRTLHEMARKAADAEGISLNHFIEIALAEKVTRLQLDSAPEPQPVARRL